MKLAIVCRSKYAEKLDEMFSGYILVIRGQDYLELTDPEVPRLVLVQNRNLAESLEAHGHSVAIVSRYKPHQPHTYWGSFSSIVRWIKTKTMADTSSHKNFYVYGIYDGEVTPDKLRYVGKGHDDPVTGYSRVSHYSDFVVSVKSGFRHFGTISDPVKKGINDLISSGKDPKIEIIERVSCEALAFEREEALILQHRDQLWNKTSGGSYGWTLNEESRRKMSISRTGTRLPSMRDETKELIRQSRLGKTLTEDHRKKISAGLKQSNYRRDPAIFVDAEKVRNYPEGRLPHNALLGHAEAKQFLIDSSGMSAEKMRQILTARLGKKVSVTGIYGLFIRYGVKVPFTKAESSETTKLRRLARVEKVTLTKSLSKCLKFGKIDKAREIEADLKLMASDPEQYFANRGRTRAGLDHTGYNWGQNNKVYLVYGPSCSGKSWVCEQLEREGRVCYVRYDGYGGNTISRTLALAEATHQDKPILFDPLSRATCFINKMPNLSVKLFAIDETYETLVERARLRGAVLGPRIHNVIKRVKYVIEHYSDFSGTSTQVLEALRAELNS